MPFVNFLTTCKTGYDGTAVVFLIFVSQPKNPRRFSNLFVLIGFSNLFVFDQIFKFICF
jgi:hypothetical protein